MVKQSAHKKNITTKAFYAFTILIAIFIAFFSLSFIIVQFVSRNEIIEKIYNEYLINEGDVSEERQKILYDEASKALISWSLTTYISGISGMIIFYVFVLFGRTKLKYGYFFRTFWAIIFFGASVGIFFTPFSIWMQVVIFFILISIAAILIWELLKQESKREQLKSEIRQEWKNKRIHEEENFIKPINKKNERIVHGTN